MGRFIDECYPVRSNLSFRYHQFVSQMKRSLYSQRFELLALHSDDLAQVLYLQCGEWLTVCGQSRFQAMFVLRDSQCQSFYLIRSLFGLAVLLSRPAFFRNFADGSCTSVREL